jgi:hypothetical protein
MTRHRTTVSRLLAAGLLAAIAGSAHAQTDIPKGGEVINLGAGSGQVVIEVKNKTGKDAYDISVSIFHDDPDVELPDITGLDIVENDGQAEDDDHVDDNGNGKLDGRDEGDSTDGSPGADSKSIMDDSGAVKDGKVAKVTVTFDGPLPEGAKIRVKFSERIGDGHFDMCMAFPMGDDGFTVALVQTGPAQMGYEVLNLGSQSLDHLSIPTHAGLVPIERARLDFPYENRIIIVDDDSVEIYDLGLPPGEAVELGLTFAKPIEFLFEETQIPIFGQFVNCQADFNGDGVVNTLDVLEFLNAWSAGDPRADINGDGVVNTRDVLAYLNLWSTGC